VSRWELACLKRLLDEAALTMSSAAEMLLSQRLLGEKWTPGHRSPSGLFAYWAGGGAAEQRACVRFVRPRTPTRAAPTIQVKRRWPLLLNVVTPQVRQRFASPIEPWLLDASRSDAAVRDASSGRAIFALHFHCVAMHCTPPPTFHHMDWVSLFQDHCKSIFSCHWIQK
jgi:hypothetical protein